MVFSYVILCISTSFLGLVFGGLMGAAKMADAEIRYTLLERSVRAFVEKYAGDAAVEPRVPIQAFDIRALSKLYASVEADFVCDTKT